MAISDRVWERPGRLSADEWEQVRLHAYHSERILAASERLAPLAPIVGMHHERLDGSGYHRGFPGVVVPMPARVLAAADAYQAMTQHRPHRPAVPPEQAERQLLEGARKGLLDADAVNAVLEVAGRVAMPARRELPAGLTEREVEVLELVAQGCSNAQIAQHLVISRRTAEHHVQHIYTGHRSCSSTARPPTTPVGARCCRTSSRAPPSTPWTVGAGRQRRRTALRRRARVRGRPRHGRRGCGRRGDGGRRLRSLARRRRCDDPLGRHPRSDHR